RTRPSCGTPRPGAKDSQRNHYQHGTHLENQECREAVYLHHCLLHELLPDGVDEVRISGSQAGGAHVAGNLATMICRVGNDVEQNVIYLAGPRSEEHTSELQS